MRIRVLIVRHTGNKENILKTRIVVPNLTQLLKIFAEVNAIKFCLPLNVRYMVHVVARDI